MSDLRDQFGDIDIYLFDQLLRGRIVPGMRIIDVGCGGGRNLIYLLRNGYDVEGADRDPAAIASVRAIAARLAPQLPSDNFRVEAVEEMTFRDGSADVVIASAVLHFASGREHFDAMLTGIWRVLRAGGVMFARLASSIGIENRVQAVGDGRFRLPDGSERFLVDERMLLDTATRLGGELMDPIKTTIVQDQRAMTTWVLRKST
jgi:SAM-dependent methyltransferase